MWLVLCEEQDLSAHWAHAGLLRRGIAPLELVTASQLTSASGWVHRITAGRAEVEFSLPDGRSFRSAEVRGCLNRLFSFASPLVAAARAGDRDYANTEWYAFFLSWLHCIPGTMLNRPGPQGLSGHWRHESEWAVLAARSGLPTVRFRMPDPSPASSSAPPVPPSGERRTVIVVEEDVIGLAAPPSILAGCRRLAELSATSLLGVDLLVDGRGGEWHFVSATPHPYLQIGGEHLLDVLARRLAGIPQVVA